MKYYITADVHGFYTEFYKALNEAGYFTDPEQHKLVILGDIFDRGQEAIEMQQFILELMEQDAVILIRGNHEDLFAEMVTIDEGLPVRHHVSNGTYGTALQLTGFDAGLAIVRNLDFAAAAQDTPYYQQIIPAMVDYYETEHYVFVHGWIPSIQERDGRYSYRTNWREATPTEWRRARWINGMDALFEFFGRKVCRHSGIVAAISAAVMLLQVPGMMHIDVNMDYTETMGEKIPFVMRLKDMLSGKIGSLYDFNVMVEFNDADALKAPANMKRIEQLEQKLGTLQLTKISGDKPRVQSVTRLVKEMNRTLNADSIEYYKIPDAQDMLTQLLFLYEISDPDALFERMDEEYKTTFIHIELSGYDANKIVEDLDSAKAYAARIFPDAKTSVVGEVVNYAEMNGKLVGGLLRSFGGSFVIIAIMMILAFGSIKAGLIGMIPNVAPVLLIGGVMGYSGMPLDMITMIVMPMILGIAVDDTIHMNNHIKYGFERTGSYRHALLLSYREIGKTMGMTTFILCAMFFVFIFSPMGALHNVGLLSIVGLGAALIADYTLTTALVYLSKPYGISSN